MSTKRYGVVYKSKAGQDVAVSVDDFNQAFPNVYNKDYLVPRYSLLGDCDAVRIIKRDWINRFEMGQ